MNLSKLLNAAGLIGFVFGLAIIAIAVVAALWRTRRVQPSRKPREVACVSWTKADQMLRANIGWRLAAEEDRNPSTSMVYLERDVSERTGAK